MKIRQTIATGQDSTRHFLCAGAAGEHFAILTLPHDGDRMSGYVGTATGNGIPVVRPVALRLNFGNFSEEQVSVCAEWLLFRGSGLKAVTGGGAEPAGMAAQADAWASFLGTTSTKRARKGEALAELTITPEHAHIMRMLGLANAGTGEVIAKRHPRYATGAPVSGFAARTIAESAAKVFPEIRVPKDLDLARAKEALACVARPTSHAVAWYATTDPELGKLRAQAAASYPVLAGLIAESPSIARRADAMEPIADALQERTGLGKAALKRLGKLRAPLPDGPLFEAGEAVRGEDALGVNRLRRTAVRGTVTLDTCLLHLAKMPPDRAPQTDADWTAFAATLSGCAAPISNALDIPPEKILEASKGNWEVFRGQLARAADFEPEAFDRRALTLSTIDALEALEDFSRAVIMPLALRSIASTDQPIPPQTPEYMRAAFAAAGEIVLGKSKSVAGSLLGMGRRYVSRIPALMAIDGVVDVEREANDARWARYGTTGFPVLAEDFTASNGLVVTPLRDHEQMRLESERLNHCVGRLYIQSARQGRTHLFSVQTADRMQSLSTSEIAAIPKDGSAEEIAPALSVSQHRALRNGTPPPEAIVAHDEWIAEMRSGRVPLAVDEIRAWRQHIATMTRGEQGHRQLVLSWAGALGTDWQNEEKAGQHWEEWTGIVGSSGVRGDNPGALFRHACMRRLVAEMSPAAAAILLQRSREAAEEREASVSDPEL